MMVKAVKAGVYISLDKPCHSRELVLNLLESRVTTSIRSESVWRFWKHWLIDTFKNHFDNLLHQLIFCGWNPQRTLFCTVLFVNIYTPCRVRLITKIFQAFNKCIYPALTHAIQTFSVYTCRHTSLRLTNIFVRKKVELRIIQISVQSLELVLFVACFFWKTFQYIYWFSQCLTHPSCFCIER